MEEVTLEEGHDQVQEQEQEEHTWRKSIPSRQTMHSTHPRGAGVQPTGLSTSKLSTASPAPPTPTPASGRRAKDSPRTHGPVLGKLLGAHFLRSDHGP